MDKGWRERFNAQQRAYAADLPARTKRAFEVFDGFADIDEQIVGLRYEAQHPNAMCRREMDVKWALTCRPARSSFRFGACAV